MAALAEKAVALLRRAVGESDPLIGTYVDLERVIVVRVKDGQCVPDDLDADQVEDDDARFAEVPIVTTSDEFLWMRDFVEEHGDRRVAGFLDGRSGANARFLKQLRKQAPDALEAWETYRTKCVHELVDAWLATLGVSTA